MDYEQLDKLYADLAGAILKQAADDYIQKLEEGKEKSCAKLEQFFMSDYGQTLSMNHGDVIIQKCRRIAEGKKRDKMARKE